MKKLKEILSKVDGKGYKAYKQLQGKAFTFEKFDMIFHYVQGDPFAAPSMIAVRMSPEKAGYPVQDIKDPVRRRAAEDYVARKMSRGVGTLKRDNKGSGKSGIIDMDNPGQEVLEQSTTKICSEYVEVRLSVGLPAFGRRIAGIKAINMLTQDIPGLLTKGLLLKEGEISSFWEHVHSVEDQNCLRENLTAKGLVAFVADGSILPRKSGVDQRPLDLSRAVPFKSPPSLCNKIKTPNGGIVCGMGIPEGVTLIAGGGYHGKSTLLRAIERGVYDHVPGDGRERVVSLSKAFKIRAEDGRRVEGVNISPFIKNLPLGKDTVHFCSDEASGSTSQAANIMEGLEAGADLLLLDEDTSATNFMIRDTRMQLLVSREKEPITPFIDKIRQLYREKGISTVIVMGGSGDYFDVADKVIRMDEFLPVDVTDEAGRIARENPTGRNAEGGGSFGQVSRRVPLPKSLDPRKGKKVKIKSRGNEHIQFGNENIKLNCLEQIVHNSQARAIGDIIYYALREGLVDGERSLREIVEELDRILCSRGIDEISPFGKRPVGNHARPRSLEIAAAINRLRTLKVEQKV